MTNVRCSRPQQPTVIPRSSTWLYVATFTVATVLIVGGTWWAVQRDYRWTLEYWRVRETHMAQVMAERLTDWLAERQGDAQVLADNPATRIALSRPPGTQAGSDVVPTLQLAAHLVASVYSYQAVYVVDSDGRVVTQSAEAGPLAESAAAIARAVVQEPAIRVDILNDEAGSGVVTIAGPVFAAGDPPFAKKVLGAVVLSMSVAKRLVPLLTNPELTRTGETLLVRREGDVIVFFTPLRHLAAGTQSLRLPFSTAELAARSALEGKEQFEEFTDYRGVTVLAATRFLPSSQWGLVRKIDRAEAFETFWKTVWLIGLASGFLILASAGLLRTLWQRTELLGVAAIVGESRRRLAAIVDSSGDAIISKTLDGIITSWNAAAQTIYGYTAEEAIGRPISILVPSEHGDEVAALLDRLKSGEPVINFETLRIRKDGQPVDVSLTVSPISDDRGTVIEASIIARDISERKRAEEALRSASLYTRSLIEASLDPLVTISPDGKITDVNHATATVTGCTREELIGTDFATYFTEPEEARAGYERVFREGVVRDYPLEIRHRDGHLTSVLYNASIYRDERGQVVGVFAAARDITERKRAEEEKEQYFKFFLLSSDAMCIADPFGCFKHVNPALMTMTGYSESELISKPFLDFVVPEDRQRTADEMRLQVTIRPSLNFENRYMRNDGTTLLLSWTAYYDKKDGVTYATARDITERAAAQEALRRLNRELRAISNCNQTLLRAEDEQTLLNDICRIVCEEAGYRMAWVGYAENDDAKTVRPIVWAGCEEGYLAEARLTWADTERGRGPAGTAIRSGKTTCIQDFTTDLLAAPWRDSASQRGYRSTIALPLRDESDHTFGILTIYSMEPNAFTPDEIRLLEELSGDLAFGIVVLRARAKRKRAEEELHQLNRELEQRVRDRTAQLEATNKELESFSYSVSHDLRAPLRAVDGFSAILLDRYGPQFDAQGRHYLQRVREGAQHMDQLVNDLLVLSRITRSEIHRQAVDLSALARTIATELHNAQPERRVEFVIADGAVVQGDAGLLRAALENLLGNAWKYTSKHATARIEFGMCEVAGAGGTAPKAPSPQAPIAREVAYFVRDDGAGFDMTYVGKLFGAFQRLHAADEFEGIGIGLAIVQRIIRRHGGRVWAEGAVEHGATFYFTLGTAGLLGAPTSDS